MRFTHSNPVECQFALLMVTIIVLISDRSKERDYVQGISNLGDSADVASVNGLADHMNEVHFHISSISEFNARRKPKLFWRLGKSLDSDS